MYQGPLLVIKNEISREVASVLYGCAKGLAVPRSIIHKNVALAEVMGTS